MSKIARRSVIEKKFLSALKEHKHRNIKPKDSKEAKELAEKALIEAGKHLRTIVNLANDDNFDFSFAEEMETVLNLAGIKWKSSSLYC